MIDRVDVEVAFALQDAQFLLPVSLPAGSTVADAIRASAIAERVPQWDLAAAPVGIWGRIVSREQRLVAGDRIELYRSLEMDPREARRRLADSGRTMREGRATGPQSRGSSS